MKLLSKPDYKVSDRGLSEIVRLTVGGVMQSLLIQTEQPGSPAPQGKQLLWSARSSHTFHHDDARENEARLIAFMQAHALGHDSKLSS